MLRGCLERAVVAEIGGRVRVRVRVRVGRDFL
jgi:hypothetical protein